jgi:hypothetical protein
MKVLPLSARIAALIVGLIAFAALAIRFAVSLEQAGSAQAAAWTMLRFFTIIGNLLTCVILFGVALGIKAAGHPRRLAGIMLLMGLIGIVYAVLLRSTENLSGPAETSNLLLHYIAPPAVALFWLIFAPKGRLAYGDTLRWALLPLAYLAYAIVRAQLDGRYPYPFLDVARHGWMQVGLTSAMIAAGFLVVGAVVVWLDRRIGRR